MANSADPDLDLHCLQIQSISGFSRTRVNVCFDYINEPYHGKGVIIAYANGK